MALLALMTAPLVLLLVGSPPPGLGFLWDLAMALGFAGFTMMGAQFLLTARFRRAAAPFGVDILYYLHRYLGVLALGLVVAHGAVAVADNPAILPALVPWKAQGHLAAGVVSLLVLVLIAVTSLARRRLRLPYDWWRVTHAGMAIAALALGAWHMHGVGYYLGDPLQRLLWGGLLATVAGVVVVVRVWRPWRLSRRPWRVARITPERGDAWTLRLEPDGHRGFAFSAGQFAWVTLRSSPFLMREHPFSIASSAWGSDGSLAFTIKELGDFTRTVGSIAVGERAYVDGPYGAFCEARYPAPTLVFVAGGIGIAPIMSMLRTLADAGDTRPLVLLFAGSRWERLPFGDEILSLARRLRLTAVFHLEAPPADWSGEHGWITPTSLAKYLPAVPSAAAYFLCGPMAMTRAVERMLRSAGVPATRVHTELFDMA
ncbi:MAG: ferric reductase-like transmembrane domain-containing protein [Gemmatimonadetes bacterium]|nr:ferric reductase-like transmembrane domain-containing protein [Gemmatimonadota bacterium]